MNKIKTIKKAIIGASIIALSIGGITLAKYTTQITGKGSADVAKWSFQANGDTQTIQTINLKDTYKEETLINGRIAPGTEGKFDILVDATGSEVGIDYKVEFKNETQKPTNLKFNYKGTEYNTLEEIVPNLVGTINANQEEKTETITVGWEWQYETGETEEEKNRNDEIDTNEGTQNIDYEFDVVISGTQVKPAK